ncbi:glutamate--cysteine ligase [Marinicella litoralis]|uniref:Glutamate--cysteine ligase n=1 Tax=Marinicella litoralis TaxID=644220 RepID=A0A4R6XTW4_9GAMM|nr:glutamate--cysteine ligase [Marinicella litoralis]TDR23412.1 glutamate--cysteine ligase [Marinicella litoralis]
MSQAPHINSKADLVDYLASGCKPKSAWRVGTEHEKFGFHRANLKPLHYAEKGGIRDILQGLASQFNWQPEYEGEHIIALKREGCSITLEPGGQLELSGAPLENVHQTCTETGVHLKEVKAIAEPLGSAFLGMGFHPSATREDISYMPKGRYKIMSEYMPKVGTLGLDMMKRTCTIQANLDFSSEADMIKKFRVSLALQPLATALFANSPFTEGAGNGFVSYRSQIWTDTDNDRCGTIPFVFDDNMGFERYVDYMLNVPMYFVYRNGQYIDATGHSFKDFMQGKLAVLPGEYPTIKDWEDHLTTAFPEVRLKKFLEMRGADGGPWRRICALPALWVGLLYDQTQLDLAYDLISDWSMEEYELLRSQVPKLGLNTPFRDSNVRELALQMLAMSRKGLEQRAIKSSCGKDESIYLEPLQIIAETDVTPAERKLGKYHGVWDKNIEELFKIYAF